MTLEYKRKLVQPTAGDYAFVAIIFLVIIVLAFCLFNTSGCIKRDGCQPGALQCTGNLLEICDNDEDWGVMADCSKAAPVWDGGVEEFVCCQLDGGFDCVKKEECNGNK